MITDLQIASNAILKPDIVIAPETEKFLDEPPRRWSGSYAKLPIRGAASPRSAWEHSLSRHQDCWTVWP
jgi:hypothetical protein